MRATVRRWAHLAARFLDVVRSRPLDRAERNELRHWLRAGEVALFDAQPVADQRHGFDCARDVALSSPERHDLIRTALLHDIGKRHAHLGPVGRVLATLFVECRLPVHGRFRMYRDHGGLGAVELAELGAEPLVVTFARNHHGSRPDDVSPGDWELLENVDHARVRRGSRSSGYSSVPVVRR